jgi:hypothetical protein
VACINLPAFTAAEQVRPQPESVVDRKSIGMVVASWSLTMESGPGRNNCKVTASFQGTGNVESPPDVPLSPWPAVETEHFLNAASASIVIGGVDYVLGQTFMSLNFTWTNNVRLESGYYPGSGVDENGFAIRGRMEYSTRECNLQFVARAVKGSPEYNALVSLDPGVANIKLEGALIGVGPNKHGIEIIIPKSVFSAVIYGEADGLVTVDCNASPLKDTTTGKYVTMCATTERNGLFGLVA